MVRTSWRTDPWALGSYSYLPVGATPDDRVRLRRPLGERVFWAGEATSSENPATVHGAVASGLRAAAEVEAAGQPGEVVIIVGAGAAGLAAAISLDESGFEVLVVEARDRVGGRLDTVQPARWPVPVERGASWVHDAEGNGLSEILNDAEVDTVEWDWDDVARLDKTGARQVGDDPAVESAVARLLERAQRGAAAPGLDRSLADQLARVGIADVDREAFARWLDREVVTELGASPETLSARWGLFEGTEGSDLLVTGGYQGIALAAAEQIDVVTSSPVRTIDWRGPRLSVRTEDRSLVCDRVVVTVPLGVLKAGGIVFDPPLPAENRLGIDRLGMGLLDKVWLRFEEPFWDEESAIWTIENPNAAPFAHWYNLAPATDEPVLLTLIGGETARRWATRNDEAVLTAAVNSLGILAAVGW